MKGFDHLEDFCTQFRTLTNKDRQQEVSLKVRNSLYLGQIETIPEMEQDVLAYKRMAADDPKKNWESLEALCLARINEARQK